MINTQVDIHVTGLDLYQQYVDVKFRQEADDSNAENILKSAVIRFLVPACGGPVPQGKRATSQEIAHGLNYLNNLSSQQVIDSLNLIEIEFETQQIAKDKRRRNRSSIKQFISWVIEEGYGSPKKQEQQEVQYERLHAAPGQARWYDNLRLGRNKKIPYALCSECFREDYINQYLKQELEEYQIYRRKMGCSSMTIQTEIKNFYQILGWLHRYKEVFLENLRLTSIIEFCQLNIFLRNCLDTNQRPCINIYYQEKVIAKEKAIEIANQNINLINEYFDFLDVHSKSKERYVDSYLSLARFVFKDEFGTEDYLEDGDIPIIRKLKQLKRQLAKEGKSNPQTISYHEKSIPWTKVVEVMERVRVRYEKKYTYSTTKRDGITQKKRTPYALAPDLQDFLSLAFMILIPPDRARTYYELEIGRTLVYGLFIDGCFTPKEKLDPSIKAKWYIHLQETDYKTGKVHGEYWGAIPNHKFQNGKNFYQYIDEWLTRERESLGKVNHNFFFTQKKTKEHGALDHKNWNDRIIHLFRREAGVPVSPHQLRSIYVTYLNESRATPEEKRAAALAMHHTERMQERVYNRQGQESKLAPIVERHTQDITRMLNQLKLPKL